MEHIDLSTTPLPPKIEDREFDERFVGDAMSYLKNIRDNSMDYVANPNKFTIKKVDKDSWNLWLESPDGIKVFAPTDWARSQTIGVTRLPKKYHDELIDGGHIDEAVNHLNMWMNDENKPRQIRTVGNQYRALVSPGYNSFDNFAAFTTIAGALKSVNMMRPETQKPAIYYKAQVSDRNLYIHLIDEGREYDAGKQSDGHSDTYKPMLVFKNSEVGDGAQSVEAGLWRWMCGNLQLHGIVSRKIHHAEKLEEGIYSPETRLKQEELWKSITRDALNAGLATDTLFDKLYADIKESKEVKVEDPIVAVKSIAKATKLTESEENEIIKAMMGDTTTPPEMKNTLFQITNGMTLAAKGMGIERGMEMNKIAGDIRPLIKVVA